MRNRLALVSSVVLGTVAALALSVAPAFAAGAAPAAPTFTKDVAPILMRSCVQCHRPGQVAPMSLLTYDEARPWARSIKTRVTKREMPPWNLDPTVGIKEILDDPSLSRERNRRRSSSWVDSGAPKGDMADMPKAPTFASVDTWSIGEPDFIIDVARVDAAGAGGRLVRRLLRRFEADRGPLDQGDRGAADRQGAQGRAPRDRLRAPGRQGSPERDAAGAHRRTGSIPTTAPGSPSTPSATTATSTPTAPRA